jgi:hypothetical protein
MILQNTVIPIDVCKTKIIALYIGYYFNHNKIIVTNCKTNTVIQKINVSYGELPKHKIYGYPYIIIDTTLPGVYSLYSDNDAENDKSNTIYTTVTGDDRQTLLKNIAGLCGLDKTDYIQQTIFDISDESDTVSYFYKHYLNCINNNDNYQKVYDFAIMLRKYIELQNCRISKLDLTPSSFCVNDNNTITIDGCAVKVIQQEIYSETTVAPKSYIPDIMKSTVNIVEQNNAVYLYKEINDFGIPLNFTMSFVPSEDVLRDIKTLEIANSESNQRILERTVDYPSSFLQFTEKELEFISYIDKLQPMLPLIRAPKINFDMGRLVISPKEETKHLIDLLGNENVYIAINELEYCNSIATNRRRIGMNPVMFYIYADSIGIGAETYMYWLENQNGDIVSDIKVLDLSSEEPIAIKYDYNESNELDEKLRRLNIYWYRKHFDPYILTYNEKMYDNIMMLANQFESDSETDAENYADNMLQAYCSQEHIFTFADVAMSIKKDYYTYSRYESNFFNNTIYFKYKHNTVVLPSQKDTIYKLESYFFNGTQNIEYIPANAQSVREYRFSDGTEFGIMSAINTETLRVSGFLLIDFSAHDIHPKIKKFMLDVSEVNY